ncbi:MAG TPA: cytidine deaminase [Anaerolineales bacterium]|nr:cytidine deaminase [Anaerolineales bacterium]
MAITSEQRAELIHHASEVRLRAYAPYSGYPVGAAVLTGSGQIYAGANVENAAYPSGICAERSAVFTAVSQGEREILAVAVVNAHGGSPCGSCRQVLSEFGPRARVIVADGEGKIVRETDLADLLPHAFGAGDLPARSG